MQTVLLRAGRLERRSPYMHVGVAQRSRTIARTFADPLDVVTAARVLSAVEGMTGAGAGFSTGVRTAGDATFGGADDTAAGTCATAGTCAAAGAWMGAATGFCAVAGGGFATTAAGAAGGEIGFAAT